MSLNEDQSGEEYSNQECNKIIDYFMDLRTDFRNEFLEENGISRSSKDTKVKVRENVQNAVSEGIITYNDLVNYLTNVEPLLKQHVVLYDGPKSDINNWRKESFFKNLISKNELTNFLDAPLTILPPESMSLCSIKHVPGKKVEIHALERLDHWKRKKEHDETKFYDGEEIELKAVVHRLDRGIIRFEWNLISNKATLHVSQLPTGYKYETIENNFKELTRSFLDLDKFIKLNLRSVIKKLHKLEENGNPEARSHDLNYQGTSGRTYGARSPSSEDPVVCDDELDKAFRTIRDKGAGHIGNFFWLPSSMTKVDKNILNDEIHTVILGEEGRVNFLAPNKKEELQYVLSRVRSLS